MARSLLVPIAAHIINNAAAETLGLASRLLTEGARGGVAASGGGVPSGLWLARNWPPGDAPIPYLAQPEWLTPGP